MGGNLGSSRRTVLRRTIQEIRICSLSTGGMSRLLWAILLGALLCELVLLTSGDPAPKKSSYRRYRRYRPHCPKPKPVPCKPSPCKPVPCKPVPCIPCNKPTAPPPTGPSCSAPRPGSHKWANNYDESFTFECPRDGRFNL